jgi:hypothetical protein
MSLTTLKIALRGGRAVGRENRRDVFRIKSELCGFKKRRNSGGKHPFYV